ncbi:MAG: hypothetical protein JWN32_150 [Solirubrobacterales bacterium]|jgi:hypothetical protein|nr:hypothetical protein [Solirubrobacterales bacterium]
MSATPDEHVARRNLLAQIGALERELGRLATLGDPHSKLGIVGRRVLSTADLERVRDELFAVIYGLRAGDVPHTPLPGPHED